MNEMSIKLLAELCKWFSIAQYGTVDPNDYDNLILEVCDYVGLDIADDEMNEVFEILEADEDIISS